MKVSAKGIAIEVEDIGAADRPAVVLVMGLGMQLIAWPDAFVDALLAAGFRVVRFDNRDIGLSQAMDHLGVPNIAWATVKHRFGMPVRAPYSLHDMAQDALAVMDSLGIERAHIVGVSMGGMIAQRIALAAPERVLSLASIMSSSGARYLPGPNAQVLRAMFSRPHGSGEEAIIDHYVRLFRAIGSPGFPIEESDLRRRLTASTRRSFRPLGTTRQLVAVAADTGRANELARITVPTLVIHGRDDPLVPVACGHDTARRIPGSKLHVVPGMGHDLAPGVVDRLLAPLLPHLKAAVPA